MKNVIVSGNDKSNIGKSERAKTTQRIYKLSKVRDMAYRWNHVKITYELGSILTVSISS